VTRTGWQIAVGLAAVCGCGGGNEPQVGTELVYTDPDAGVLRLMHDRGTHGSAVVLTFLVGDQPLSGYATGFNLPIAPGEVALGGFTPGTGLDPGLPPLAAKAVIPTQGPLAGMLVAAQSQKASGAGAVFGDTALAPRTVLFTVRLELALGATTGTVFDGAVPDFALPSGGLRNLAGTAVVSGGQVGIGKLEVR